MEYQDEHLELDEVAGDFCAISLNTTLNNCLDMSCHFTKDKK